MSIYAIGRITIAEKVGRGYKDKIVGLKLYDTESKVIKSVALKDLYNAQISSGFKIENATIENNLEVTGTQGHINRLPLIDIQGKCKADISYSMNVYRVVAIAKRSNEVLCVDFRGNEKWLDIEIFYRNKKEYDEEIEPYRNKIDEYTLCPKTRVSWECRGTLERAARKLKPMNCCGIANAKFVENKSGTIFVQGINHEIPEVTIADERVEGAKKSFALMGMNEQGVIVDGTTVIITEKYDKPLIAIPEGFTQVSVMNKIDTNDKKHLDIALPKSCKILDNGDGSRGISVGNVNTDYLQVIGKRALYKSPIKRFIASTNLHYISDSAFYKCEELESVDLTNYGSESIGESAFCECSKLKDLKLNDKITIINHMTFFRSSLSNGVDLSNIQFVGKDGLACTDLIKADLKNCMTLGEGALCYCGKLLGVRLNENMTAIKQRTFMGSEKLHIINLEHIKEIGMEAFKFCKGLNNLHLDAIETISKGAFDGCKLYNVYIGANILYVESGAFDKCFGTAIHFKEESRKVAQIYALNLDKVENVKRRNSIYVGKERIL